MDTPEQREALTRLISRLLDEDKLTSEERTLLNETLLADPEARRVYRQYIDMQLEFACLTQPEAISEEGLAKIVRTELASSVPVTAPLAAAAGDSRWSREVASKPRRRWPEFTAAAAAAAVIISFAINHIARPANPATIGMVENATGEVQFEGGSTPEEVTAGIEVKANQTLVTHGEKSSAVFVFEDGTSLVVAGDTTITTVDGAKRVVVTDGAVAASVSPQPVGKPLIVSTPIAEIQVVGTQFSVNHSSELTDLAVTHGAVVIKRHSDGSSKTVTKGQRIFAERSGLLRVEKLPNLAVSWRADFEDGQRHRHCHLGEPTREGLPQPSKGALRAVRVEDPDQAGRFTEQAAFGTPWAEGLVMAREKTHLHLRYQLKKPGPLQVQIKTRTDGPKPQLASYHFDDFTASLPDQWLEASIPLKLFHNPADSGDRTMAGEIPLTLLVVAPFDQSGLVIDEIGLNTQGSGNFHSAPVQ